jgi:CBS-domain-containing membrane protein
MTPAVRWMRPDDDLIAATRQMLAWRISALPVIDHGQLAGILTTTDCLNAMLEVTQAQRDAAS